MGGFWQTESRQGLSRRDLLRAGALVVSFTLFPQRLAAQENDPPVGDLRSDIYLDSWISIQPDGRITVFTGKVELGQGITTALAQCAAEQLKVPFESVSVVTASTQTGPNESYTAGSNSMTMSGNAITNAAAQVRAILAGWAATEFGVEAGRLSIENGTISDPNGRRVAYGDLVKGRSLHVKATPQSDLVPPSEYKIMGKNIARLDIPGKVTGHASFIQDMRPDGLLHARVVRPPSYSSRLRRVNTTKIEAMPGVVKVVHQGDFLAVLAEEEYQAIVAMRAMQGICEWTSADGLPGNSDPSSLLKSMKAEDQVIEERGEGRDFGGTIKLEARYTRPYVMHGSIGPSCAVAHFKDARLRVWTHSQGVFELRAALAQLFSMPLTDVDCIHVPGAGCYGHNGADDAAADAAILAMAVDGRPVRVQWMREDEHGWEPYGSPMVGELKASVNDGHKISSWDYQFWSMTFTTRPGGKAGNLMPSWYLPQRLGPPQGFNIPLPSGGGTNAVPFYDIPNSHVLYHYIPNDMPLRVSAHRSLGSYFNVFAAESFMDELAEAAKVDPVEFRLRHTNDLRAHDVIRKAAEEFGWTEAENLPRFSGRGFAFLRFETYKTYCALAVEIEVNAESGRIRVKRAVAAVDSGNAVNPDGIQNQIQGAIMQSMSWTLHEQVSFDQSTILSRDWASYPILRFLDVPDSVDVHVINRPDEPFLGTGEAGMGPVPAAIANALYDATGARIRDLPLSPDKIRTAISHASS